jgi:ribonuclease D
MIHRLLTVCSVAVVAFVFATPTSAHAATNPKQIKNLSKQLNKLPNQGGPNAKVAQLVKKLAKLDPVKAQKYYKTGLKELAPEAAELTALSMAKIVTNIVKASGLPEGKINSIVKTVNRDANKYVPPTPTPTPYQAMLWHAEAVAGA